MIRKDVGGEKNIDALKQVKRLRTAEAGPDVWSGSGFEKNPEFISWLNEGLLGGLGGRAL